MRETTCLVFDSVHIGYNLWQPLAVHHDSVLGQRTDFAEDVLLENVIEKGIKL